MILSLIENGHRWEDIKNYTMPEIKFLYRNSPRGLSDDKRADIMEAVLFGTHPGEKGKEAIQFIKRLRYGRYN